MSTHKQKLVAKKILENRGMSISKAMREAGYSPATAKNPSNLTNSLGWNELMNKYISEEALLKTHQALLKHRNWRARDAALEKGYKLLGKYKATKFVFDDPFEDMTMDELDAEIERLKKESGYHRYKNSTPKALRT